MTSGSPPSAIHQKYRSGDIGAPVKMSVLLESTDSTTICAVTWADSMAQCLLHSQICIIDSRGRAEDQRPHQILTVGTRASQDKRWVVDNHGPHLDDTTCETEDYSFQVMKPRYVQYSKKNHQLKTPNMKSKLASVERTPDPPSDFTSYTSFRGDSRQRL
jgi:hypothetical protein